MSSASCSVRIFVIFARSLTRFRCRPFLLFVVRLGAGGIIGISVAGVGTFPAADGVGGLVVGCGSRTDGSGVLFLVVRRWMRGAVRTASGAVGLVDVVGETFTLEFGVFTLEFDAGPTLEGGTASSRSGVHLFCLGVWFSERTLVSERKILQWFRFSIALTGTICLNISRRSVAAMIVWSASEMDGMRACVGNNLYVPLLVQYPVFGFWKYISR